MTTFDNGIRSRFATLKTEVARRSLSALLLAAVAAPVLAPAIGAEPGQTEFAPGQGGSVDYDNDGLTQDQELYWGLDPYTYDTDGDIIGDGDEFYDRYGYSDPLDYDTDNDRLADGEEVFIWGSDPYRYDTDGDGADDNFEAMNGTNPRDPNSR